MSGPENISDVELLWYKGFRILNKAVALELRQLFRRLWNQKHPTNPWQDDQTSGEIFYNDYKPKRLNGRYDDIIKNGKLGDWDMTVLCRAFIDYSLMNTMDRKYSTNVHILRDLRNTYAHSPNSSRQQGDYQKDIAQIRKVFTELGLSEETLNEAESITPDDIERRELLSVIETLIQEQAEFREEVRKRLPEHGEDQPDQQDPSIPEWFRAMPHEQQQRVISNKFIGRIAEHIGAEWQLIAAEMDISRPKRQAIVAKTPNSNVEQVMGAFEIWKQNNSHKATIASLIQILWQCKGRCDNDWESVEEVVMGDW
ncbi:uncharacterized protein LOC124145211 isoform X2 [Haliotis rufescens]|uniref:uncharacterized protein LOC124145211 isoform X2 n=1 Tax=Haliotis rufescens TaxID=6454 RepID=UPI00201E7A67|nr:uncharacterized protein LOC124145211 isoform X2 [Haliotis rufescens]